MRLVVADTSPIFYLLSIGVGIGKLVGELEDVGDLLSDSRPVAIKRDCQ